MEESIRNNLIVWIRANRFSSTHQKPLVRIEMLHSAAKGPEALDEFEVTREVPDIDLVDSIEAVSGRDSESLGGRQTYILRPYYDGVRKAGSPFRFRVQSSDPSMGEDAIDSEPATEKGLLRQSMRHTEVALSFNFKTQAMNMDMLYKQISRLTKRNEELEARLDNQGKMYEELRSLEHERELTTLRFEANEKRKDDAIAALRPLLPAVIQKVTGVEIDKDSHPMLVQFQQFAKTLKPEQLPKLMAALDPEQAAQVMTLLDVAL